MSWKKTPFLFLVISILFAACGGAAESQLVAAPGEALSAPAAEPFFDSGADFEVVAEEAGGSSFRSVTETSATVLDQAPVQERLIIRTGNLAIVVEDTEETIQAITQLVEENGGWVVSSSVYQFNSTAKTGEITVRIPAEGFNSAVEAIKGMALEVTSESSSGEDVTDEYVDLNSRLANLEATAARVRNFLDESKNVEEALAVNAELSRLESEIEVIKGRMQYLSQSAAFSTLTISLTPDELSQPIEVGGWRPQGVARDAIEALITAVQTLASFLIWVVIFLLPLLLLILVPLWFVIRFWRKRRRANL
ncbi:MAG: DUF4349 domain-containing protein [Anaerolineae bacterium]